MMKDSMGGAKIGRRRLDTHFLGFKYLGASFVHDEERNVYQIQAKKLKGCYMLLDEASVTGTANIIMASVLAEGTTTIYNAACEPYIVLLFRDNEVIALYLHLHAQTAESIRNDTQILN